VPRLLVAHDHAAFALKADLVALGAAMGWTIEDLGANTGEKADYPDKAYALAEALKNAGPEDRGLLICGSGIGICMAANRYAHVRAALCHDVTSAILCRQHNDANVLCLGARLIGLETAKATLVAFLSAEFEGGRHEGRVQKLAAAFTAE